MKNFRTIRLSLFAVALCSLSLSSFADSSNNSKYLSALGNVMCNSIKNDKNCTNRVNAYLARGSIPTNDRDLSQFEAGFEATICWGSENNGFFTFQSNPALNCFSSVFDNTRFKDIKGVLDLCRDSHDAVGNGFDVCYHEKLTAMSERKISMANVPTTAPEMSCEAKLALAQKQLTDLDARVANTGKLKNELEQIIQTLSNQPRTGSAQ